MTCGVRLTALTIGLCLFESLIEFKKFVEFLLSHVNLLLLSIESNKVSWPLLLEEFRLFQALGYKRFKVIKQSSVHRQVCPFPAKEGQFVEHSFPMGSSGLFGEEAPGDWLSADEAVSRYREVCS